MHTTRGAGARSILQEAHVMTPQAQPHQHHSLGCPCSHYGSRIVKSFAFLSRISTKQIGEQSQLAADTLRGNPLEGLARGESLGGACSGGIPRRGLLWGNSLEGLALGECLKGTCSRRVPRRGFLRGHPSYLVGACFSMGDGGVPLRGLLNRKGGPSLSLSLCLT